MDVDSVVDIIVDLRILESAIFLKDINFDSCFDEKSDYYKKYFLDNNISIERFTNSFNYYVEHREFFLQMIEEPVEKKLYYLEACEDKKTKN
ncbi:MAG: DUF4296 domain-containing protein [Bacteroidales bacterium]